MSDQRRHLALVVPAPLPECRLCERPTRRDVHERYAGLCSDCNDGVQAIADRLGYTGRRFDPDTIEGL
jgi:hypothetical protein